ncbi:MAG TPA: bifunctional demethylmenaquinone methyltransferase/2-methoxy-6-polyprenyl-1,4-benzoquinol methylase UbiE [Bryobacteraceae bacterium]|nr:bifunctional demethylmenaquinone methyltransferase/2-methoxy-6-polyprenyl-1,4-benzoquinol methylase UbiE [Bryobacteraceae bacterium]
MLTRTSGTTPAGIQDPEQAARWVRGMFGRIAPRYDLLNNLLSLNIDRHWRAAAVRRLETVLASPDAHVLDVACGTGELMLALAARGRAQVFGSDFCHPMLVAARDKAAARVKRTPLFEADALKLPVADASLDLATIAFGFRNLADYEQGLRELRRILKPGGVLAILEFSTPPNALLASVYGFYSRAILPTVGGWISGSRDAYSYLPESVRKFPSANELAERMRAAGFTNVRFHRMTAGIVALHLGERP